MNSSDAQKVHSFLELAHSDHLAARHLLRYGFLEQGCILASTAVEKYLKAIIGVHGMARTEHIDKKLLALVRQVHPEVINDLNEDFLLFLGKCFRLRYASVTSPEFSIVINQYKTLAALDRTVDSIDSGFRIEKGFSVMMATYQTEGVNFHGSFLKKTEIGIGKSTFQLARG